MRIITIYILVITIGSLTDALTQEEKKANLIKDLKNDKTELFSGSRERRYPGNYGNRYPYGGYGNRYPYGGYGNRYPYGGYGQQYNPYQYPYYTTVGFPLSLFTTTPPLPFPFYYFTTPPPFPFNLFGKKK